MTYFLNFRHHGCVIWLTYEPEGPVTDTVMMVGKGITYDTGGADIKVSQDHQLRPADWFAARLEE